MTDDPQITYPFSIDTLGKVKQTEHSLSLNCHVCHVHVMLDMDRLIERFGAGHGSMDADLRRHFYCRKCREAGRKDKDFAFILHAPGPKDGPYARRVAVSNPSTA